MESSWLLLESHCTAPDPPPRLPRCQDKGLCESKRDSARPLPRFPEVSPLPTSGRLSRADSGGERRNQSSPGPSHCSQLFLNNSSSSRANPAPQKVVSRCSPGTRCTVRLLLPGSWPVGRQGPRPAESVPRVQAVRPWTGSGTPPPSPQASNQLCEGGNTPRRESGLHGALGSVSRPGAGAARPSLVVAALRHIPQLEVGCSGLTSGTTALGHLARL